MKIADIVVHEAAAAGSRRGAARRGASRRLVWHRLAPNRDAAERYSDCALSGFAEFFPAATKGGSPGVNAGQKPRWARAGAGRRQKRAVDMDVARSLVSQGKF
jgi:hypothetical protein